MPGCLVTQTTRQALRINVGFLLHQGVGTSRDFDFAQAHVQVAPDLTVTDLHGTLRLSRTAQGLYAQGRLRAGWPADCVRCLESFNQALSIELHDLFVYPPSEAADPILQVPETGILDLSPLVREYLLLDVPLQPLCRPDCKGLCPECGVNRNLSTCSHPTAEIDPRLSPLSSLLSES